MKFSLFIFCLFGAGCMKDPEITQDFGSQVSTEAMQEAINQIPNRNPLGIQAGEFAYTETTTQLESIAPATTAQRADTVTDRSEDNDGVYLTIVTKVGERGSDGQMQQSETESHPVVSKHADQRAANVSDLMNPLNVMKAMDARLSKMDEDAPPTNETYHNLRVSDIKVAIPASVLARTNCGGLSPEICRSGVVNGRQLQFDKVRWANNLGDRTGYSFTFSTDVPYFAHLMELCQEAHVTYHAQRIHVYQCEQVRDFRFHN